jgi:hypothetical protein
MKRVAFLGTATALLAAPVLGNRADAAELDISLQTATGVLYGTLAVPSKTPAPVVLIIAGSGPTDRNGNSALGLQTNAYGLLAAALAQRGVASVRYDKRGVGASASPNLSEKDLRFETYVDDAAAWLRLLRADRRFSKVAVAGHSEGSLIGMVAIQSAPADAFISLEGVGRPAAVVLREQLKRNLSADLYAQSDAILAQLQQGRLVPNPPPQLALLFRESVQPYLISWLKYDPAVEIAKIHIPATIVQGTADVQVSVQDAQALKRADPAADLIVITGMNHVLKYAPDTSSQAAILEGYQNAALPIDPGAVDAVYSAATKGGSRA